MHKLTKKRTHILLCSYLRQVSEDLELDAVIKTLLSSKQDANKWKTKVGAIRLKDFLPGPVGIVNSPTKRSGSTFTTTFNEAAAALAKKGEVLIGWKVDGQAGAL
jgi:hypothetical protein